MDAVTDQTPRLFIFPHAGGTADFYASFARAFGTATKCVAVQYPGKRGGKDLSRYTAITELADRLSEMIKPAETPGSTVGFFGHSMGALLAFELALRFQRAGNPIAALFVSASAAPGLIPLRDEMQRSDHELLKLVGRLTGANPEFLGNEQFAATLMPTLRGLRAVAAYDSPPGETVSCPIHALVGEDDEFATAELAEPWRQRTTADFDLTVFPGGHFFIDANLPALAHWVQERLPKVV